MIAEERSAGEQSQKKRRFSFLFDDANLRFCQGKTVGYQDLKANWWTEGTNAPYLRVTSSCELQLKRRSRHSLRSFVKHCLATRKLNSYLRATDEYPLFHLPEIGLEDEVASENLANPQRRILWSLLSIIPFTIIITIVVIILFFRCNYFILFS